MGAQVGAETRSAHRRGSADASRVGSARSDAAVAYSGKKAKQAARDARLAAALRENLKRRKAQTRAREQPAAALRKTGAGREGGAEEGKNRSRSD
jgi:hypothetical protein